MEKTKKYIHHWKIISIVTSTSTISCFKMQHRTKAYRIQKRKRCKVLLLIEKKNHFLCVLQIDIWIVINCNKKTEAAKPERKRKITWKWYKKTFQIFLLNRIFEQHFTSRSFVTVIYFLFSFICISVLLSRSSFGKIIF